MLIGAQKKGFAELVSLFDFMLLTVGRLHAAITVHGFAGHPRNQPSQRNAKVGPRWVQDGTRMDPGCWQDGAKIRQDGAKIGQDGAKMDENGAMMRQDGVKTSQDAAQMGPRWPKMRPDGAKRG